jgi:hypothetical protein
MVKTFGDQLLTRPALADDEHRSVKRRSAARALDRIEKRKALANELLTPLHAPTVGGKSHHLARNFALSARAKTTKSLKSGFSSSLAQLLYGLSQV